MDASHDDGLSARLTEARLALYRPDADDATRARYEALRGVVPDSSEEMSGPPRTEGVRATTRSWRVRMEPVVVTALILLLLVGAGFAAVFAASTPRRQPVLSTRLPLATALVREPSVLPVAWRNARVAAASDALDGATPLHAHRRVLLVVRCPSADRSFQAVAGTRTAYGACGRPAFVPLADGSRVVVTTRGVLPFSAALLVLDAGS